jgi:hypothetical protein
LLLLSLLLSLSLTELIILCLTAAAVLQLVREDAAFRRHGPVEHSLRWRAVVLHRSRYSRASAKPASTLETLNPKA